MTQGLAHLVGRGHDLQCVWGRGSRERKWVRSKLSHSGLYSALGGGELLLILYPNQPEG